MLRIGTRGSPLALWQANFVKGLLEQARHAVELVIIQTAGDQVRDVPLAQIGGEGVFTKAIQDALLANHVDIAVHSLKDLPTIPVEGLVLAAVPSRGPTGDAFLSKKASRFADLPPGSTLATSSLRRRAMVLHRRPDLKLVDIRGNVETRLRKMTNGEVDALVLAEAGLKRLGLADHITELLGAEWMLPAVGQGALGLECRADDETTRAALAPLDDPDTHRIVIAERAFLYHLGGGCQVPLGVQTRIDGDRLTLRGVVVSPDGDRRIEETVEGNAADAEAIGIEMADRMRRNGAAEYVRPMQN